MTGKKVKIGESMLIPMRERGEYERRNEKDLHIHKIFQKLGIADTKCTEIHTNKRNWEGKKNMQGRLEVKQIKIIDRKRKTSFL